MQNQEIKNVIPPVKKALEIDEKKIENKILKLNEFIIDIEDKIEKYAAAFPRDNLKIIKECWSYLRHEKDKLLARLSPENRLKFKPKRSVFGVKKTQKIDI